MTRFVERMSRLTLESMSIATMPQEQRLEDESDDLSYDSDTDTSIDFDEMTGVATFPSGMKYSVRGLDQGTRDTVIKALNPSSKLTVRGCSTRGQGYVFLLSETMEYHVRVPCGSDPYGTPYDGPSCSCQQDENSNGLQHPCRHKLWLNDQILSQMVPLPKDHYTWTMDGNTAEHGNVCDYIPDYHLDVLADGLRCDIMGGGIPKPRPRRIQTAREILATISGNSIDSYRPDLTGDKAGRRVVKEGDLEETIFRMLLENDSLLSYFLFSMRNHGALNPRFRRFRDRADAAFEAFDEYTEASDEQKTKLSKGPQWCRTTIQNLLDQIKSIVTHTDTDLDDSDGRAAADTLVYILTQIVRRSHNYDGVEPEKHGQANQTNETNLFNDLIVKSNHAFILDILKELQPEFVFHLLPELIRIEQTVSATGVPQDFLNTLADIIASLRSTSSRSSSVSTASSRKRSSEDGDRYSKRVR